jgi:hypothetical protein
MLRELLADAAVHARMLPYTGALDSTSRQLRSAGAYKEIHEALHNLRFEFDLMRDDIDAFESDERARRRIERHQEVLTRGLLGLRSSVKSGRLPIDDFSWFDELEQAGADLTVGLRDIDRRYVTWAYDAVSRVLDIRPTEINARLDDAAKDVRLADLAEALDAARAAITHKADLAEATAQLNLGAAAFRALGTELGQLVIEHKRWQALEPELRISRDDLMQGSERFSRGWRRLHDRLEQMYSGSAEAWAVQLAAECRILDERVATRADGGVIDGSFTSCESVASRRFYAVDGQLRNMCAALQGLGGQLDSLLRALGTPV